MVREISITAGGTKYDFPSCALTYDLVKNLLLIPVPEKTIGKDLLMNTEGYRLVGEWLDKPGDPAFARFQAFKAYFKTETEQATFAWGDTSETVLCRELHFDAIPGKGEKLLYNIVIAVVEPQAA